MQDLYKVPDDIHRKNALGSLPGLPYRLKKSLQVVATMFQPMQKPKKGEWLWEQQEEGQTYDAYKNQLHNEVNQKPLENMEIKFLNVLKDYCECFFYPMEIIIIPFLSSSFQKVKSRINPYTERNQYNARDILQDLKKNLKINAFCLIGICMTDLYPREEWNYVFGLASIRERTGVFSFARYDERFFSNHAYQIDYDRILWRSIAVMVHEITHMFGVRHCVFYKCVMNGSNSLEQSCSRPMQLCGVCLRKLQSNIKFDILERYTRILKFTKLQQGPKNLLKLVQQLRFKIDKNIK